MRPAGLFALVFLIAGPCVADETGTAVPEPASTVAPAPVTSATSASEIAPNAAIFKRSPAPDGNIETGEWDTFFSSAALDTYANWDSNNLYVAMRSGDLARASISLDLKDDGWYQGDDNFEIAVGGLAESQTPEVRARMYDPRAARGDRLSGLSDIVIHGVTARTGGSDGSRILEIVVPSGALRGLVLRPGTKIGLRIAAQRKGGAWFPTEDPGAVFSCRLTDQRYSAPDGLDVELKLSDTKVVVGQKLAARLTFSNKGTVEVPASYFVVGGEGAAAKMLDSDRRVVDGAIRPGQRVRYTYRSIIPPQMDLGSWAVGAELRRADDTRVAAALAAFEIVEPFEFNVIVGGGGLSTDPSQRGRITLKIFNNTDRAIFGRATVKAPVGWQVSHSSKPRHFLIEGEDQGTSLSYDVRVAQGTPPGQYELKFELEIDRKVYPVSQEVTVAAAPGAVVAPTPPEK